MPADSFRTVDGEPVTAVTADEMRAVDRVAVTEVGLELLQMMENAGRALAWHTRAVTDGAVHVVAGDGGNGGGGLACARHLANRDVPVTVVLDREPESLTGATATQYDILAEMGLETTVGADSLASAEPAVVVDALVGYGLDGEVRAPARQLVEWVNQQSTVVALDVPSGLDATTGETLGVATKPDRVVTLALPKTGLDAAAGSLFLADIGIPRTVYERLDIASDPPFGTQDWVELRNG